MHSMPRGSRGVLARYRPRQGSAVRSVGRAAAPVSHRPPDTGAGFGPSRGLSRAPPTEQRVLPVLLDANAAHNAPLSGCRRSPAGGFHCPANAGRCSKPSVKHG